MPETILENESPIEWLSLDDYVSNNKDDSILYVRVRGESMLDVGINTGDLAVVDRNRKPISTDVVLCDASGTYAVRKYSNVETINNPLRLVARNGEPVTSKGDSVTSKTEHNSFEIIGVITHVVKTFSN